MYYSELTVPTKISAEPSTKGPMLECIKRPFLKRIESMDNQIIHIFLFFFGLHLMGMGWASMWATHLRHWWKHFFNVWKKSDHICLSCTILLQMSDESSEFTDYLLLSEVIFLYIQLNKIIFLTNSFVYVLR